MTKIRIAKILTVALLGGLLSPGAAGGATTADSSCWNTKATEKKFARKINSVRSNASIGKLRLDPELSKVARTHTKAMVRKKQLFHQSSTQFRTRVTNWTIIGENVGYGGGVPSLHRAFMNSPLHKANIVNPSFRYVGVGVIKAGDTMWVTTVFEARTNPGTTLNMPSC